MAEELAFVLINPYTISKSRTGGVIARYVGRTDLTLVGARMFGPSQELVTEFAELMRQTDQEELENTNLIADYILKNYAPHPATGKPRRVMLLLFEGENAVGKIWHVTGSATLKSGSGETVRDTYGDYILDDNEQVKYCEPAVLVAPSKAKAADVLKLWARHSDADGGVIENAFDVPAIDAEDETLVVLKPDNFRFPSSRPGNIIDLLSSANLRIIGVKKFGMSVDQAEEFYGPVKNIFRTKFRALAEGKAVQALSREFGYDIPADTVSKIGESLANLYADAQFGTIIKFMTGKTPAECPVDQRSKPGSEVCIGLVYAGQGAVAKIRQLLGSTDPNQARPGSVRKEYGSNVLVNAAHASDSPENVKREMGIIKMREDNLAELVEKHYGL